MKILSTYLVLFTLFLLSSCNSSLDIHLLSQNQTSAQETYFSTTNPNYNLNNYQLDFSLIKDSSKTKYPAAVVTCHFIKDSNPTDLCSSLSPSLNIDNAGHFTWNTNYTENGSYFFTITSAFNGKSETTEFTVVVNNANRTPSMDLLLDQAVNEDEAIDIVTPVASDVDGDHLTFTCLYSHGVLIDQDCSDLSVVFNPADGTLNWTPHYPHSGNYLFKIMASDGSLSAQQSFTVNVTAKAPFITQWQTTGASEAIAIPLNPSYSFNFVVDWGDGASETITSSNAVHTYANAGLYTVTIRGVVPSLNFDYWAYASMKGKLIKVIDLGDVGWVNLSNAFMGAYNLVSFKGGNTSEVIDMSMMFASTSNLTELDLSSFNTSKVKDMSNMFSAVASLKAIDVSSFDTSSVTNMNSMFNYMLELESLDVSSFDTSNVTNMSGMFANLRKATSLNVSNFDTSKVTTMASMFSNMYEITTLNLGNFHTEEVKSMVSMFENNYELTSLNISSFNTAEVTNMALMFSSCRKLTSLNLSHFDTRKVTTMAMMFRSMNALTSLNVSNFETPELLRADYMFQMVNNLTSLSLPKFNTAKVTSMKGMFFIASKLTSLNLSHFDTSSVEDMGMMFNSMAALTSLNISNFETHNVVNMSGMFGGGNQLTSLDLSHFDTSKVEDMSSMFIAASSLTNLNISRFDTHKVKDMSSMFAYSGMTSLNVTHFDTSAVTKMGNMFAGLLQLSSLDLSTFDTSAVVEMDSVFSGANIPKVLLQGYTTANPAKTSWDTANVANPTGAFSNSALINTYCTGSILTRACDFDPATF